MYTHICRGYNYQCIRGNIFLDNYTNNLISLHLNKYYRVLILFPCANILVYFFNKIVNLKIYYTLVTLKKILHCE